MKGGTYYNEFDHYAAQWLRNLIAAGLLPDGDVDDRSITEVQPDDLRGYAQCHFFAGIGGWPLALRMAGWDDARPVWTGSCPCQALSSAARGRNVADDLWPVWCDLIAAMRPRDVFGEQVANRPDWFDRLCDDMEPLGYSIGAAVLPAVGVGQDHIRHRLFYSCHADSDREPRRAVDAETPRLPRHRRDAGDVVRPHGVSPRVAQLRAFGNGIVPELGARFVSAFLGTRAAA